MFANRSSFSKEDPYIKFFIYRGVEQLVARQAHNL